MNKKFIAQIMEVISALVTCAVVMLPAHTITGIGPIPPLW